MNKKEQIEELLTRGVEEIIQKPHLETALKSGKKLRIKLGIDPTSPNIHIGRAVVLWKLRAFQELGHKVIFIVGDFTGLIGDTSDKESERPQLSEAQVKANLKSYFKQAFLILDKSKTETHYNSKWLKKLGLRELGKLANAFGLHEFSSRELIKKRLDLGKRVSVRELLYPLMQGYDSIAVKANVELGGTDQRYNMLAGRVLQPLYNQAPQDIMMFSLLEGTDGRKMSSSWGNVINITESPNEMFGKVMSVNDDLIKKYFTLATRMPLAEVEKVIKNNKNPRDQKIILAEDLTSLYHGKQKAVLAKQSFVSQFSNKQLPDKISEVSIAKGIYQTADLLLKLKLVESKSEARRIIEQNGLKVDGQLFKESSIEIKQKNHLLIQVGKRRFIRIK
jgi:tyrosyl-tRNA synthetase